MGKPTGFMEYKRSTIGYKRPLDRVKHWNEFNNPFDDEKLALQAARCMDCGTPFCHPGVLLAGMAMGCPINNLIPEWNDLIYRGLWKEAYERLNRTNNFPEFTGRVCPAPCEGSCTLGINEPAVCIKNIEYAIIERAFQEGWVLSQPPLTRTGKRVAVVGSGPAGLSCAQNLNKCGHLVKVFERADRIGGLLMYGIPNMKLDKEIVNRRVRIMEAEGIEFVVNTNVGTDYPVDKLLEDFDAVVLCGGSTMPRNLVVDGRDLESIHYAMDFLKANTKSLLDSKHEDNQYISAKDKDVVVIGGGDTGTDCVATSIRQGCRSVTQLEIMPKPPEIRKLDNPWPQWPKVYSQDYGQEEASEIFGDDPRQYCMSTKSFVGDDSGNVKKVSVAKIEWVKDEQGRFAPKEIDGSQKFIDAQLVLLAMGFTGPEDNLLQKLSVAQDKRTNVLTEEDKYATNIQGIFTAGDMRRGQSLVVWAIQEGKLAAKHCNTYLNE